MMYSIIVMQKHKEKSNEIEVSDGDPSKIQEIQNLVFLTPKQAAIYLQLSSKTIWTHTRRGLLPVCRIGGLVRYRRQALDETLAKLETRSTARK
jgi:excisionase family DNA binding protein